MGEGMNSLLYPFFSLFLFLLFPLVYDLEHSQFLFPAFVKGIHVLLYVLYIFRENMHIHSYS